MLCKTLQTLFGKRPGIFICHILVATFSAILVGLLTSRQSPDAQQRQTRDSPDLDWLPPDTSAVGDLLDRCDVPTSPAQGIASPTEITPRRIVLNEQTHNEWFASKQWHREALLHRYGNASVLAQVVSSGIRAQFGHTTLPSPKWLKRAPDPSHNVSLLEFARSLRQFQPNEEPHMVFDVTGGLDASRQMNKTWPMWPSWVPQFLGISDVLPRPVLSIGGNGSGLAFHAHGPTWLATLKGYKVWFLIPPQNWPVRDVGGTPFELQAMGNSMATSLLSRPPTGMKICTVRSGQAMIVPQDWQHATLNLGETVAVGSQLPVRYKATVPTDIRTALEASYYGERAFSGGNMTVALSFFTLATELEPLNFKHTANLITALLSTRRFDEAVRLATASASAAIGGATPNDASYVLRFFALRFSEAASLKENRETMVGLNLIDFVKRLTSAIPDARNKG